MMQSTNKNQIDPLIKHNQEYPAWDPMILHDGKQWLLYFLTTQQKKTAGFDPANFFTAANYIHGFASPDLESWQDLGPVITAQTEEERVCAGSLYKENDLIYFFYSSTVKQLSPDLLDQRLFLATSTDGINFNLDHDFNLPPDASMYPTKCFNPETGEMMFAWRDPAIFKDPKSGKYYLFICAGAVRWGVPPQVGIAVADQIAGPYKLLPPAAEPKIKVQDKLTMTLGEIERIQVHFHDERYYMFCSSWRYLLSPEFLKICEDLGYEITDSTIYVLSSDNVEGPYEFDFDNLIVKNSSHTGFYGSWLVPSPLESEVVNLTGWYTDKFTVNIDQPFRFNQNGKDCFLTNNNALRWKKLKYQVKQIGIK